MGKLRRVFPLAQANFSAVRHNPCPPLVAMGEEMRAEEERGGGSSIRLDCSEATIAEESKQCRSS